MPSGLQHTDWLTYRTWQVVTKPADELISLLGLEVPATPDVSLASVKSDGVVLRLNRKASHHRASVVKHQIRLNGIIVGEISPNEPFISVTALRPDHFYNIRVVAVNSANFSAASSPVRVKTSPYNPGNSFETGDQAPEETGSAVEHYHRAPKVQPYKNFLNVTPAPIVPPTMTREHSGSQSHHPRRLTTTRRPSPATTLHDPPVSPIESRRGSWVGSETMQQLTEKLEGLRREKTEFETQISVEMEEFHNQRSKMQSERDKIKLDWKDKEDKSREIRKEMNHWERQCAQASNKKQAQARTLNQRQSERRRMEDDMIGWTKEIEDVEEELKHISEETERAVAASNDRIVGLKAQHSGELAKNKSIEIEIQTKATQLKRIDEQRGGLHTDQSEGNEDIEDQRDNEESRRRAQGFNRLHLQYVQAHQSLHHVQGNLAQKQQQLESLQHPLANQGNPFSPASSLENMPLRNSSLRRRQTPTFQGFNASPRHSFLATTATSHPGSVSSISPSFSTPWLGMDSAALSGHASQSSFSQGEIDQLTGGGPLSPRVHDLLPSGLFKDDVDDPQDRRGSDGRGSEQSTSASASQSRLNISDIPAGEGTPGDRRSGVMDPFYGPYLPGDPLNILTSEDKLPGLGAIQESQPLSAPRTRSIGPDHPQSPVSVSSRSPSVFASPRVSTQNLPQTASDNLVESDRQSIRSTGSNRGVIGGQSRFGQFFGGLSRPRTNTNPGSDEPPVLGSLPGGQTQSLPRQEYNAEGSGDSQSRPANRSAFLGHVSNLVSRGSTRSAAESSGDSKFSGLLRQRPTPRSKDTSESWGPSWASDSRPISPRPISTHSSELPRPKGLLNFGLGSSLVSRQNSQLNTDWNSFLTSTHSFSQHPSRRPSEQYSQSGSIPYNEALLEQDPIDFPSAPATPPQAPIGTKPSKKPAATVPKLNPAAKSFNIFSREKKGEKSERAEKGEKPEKVKAKSKGKDKDNTKEAEDDVEEPAYDDYSPSDSRLSKDAPSLSTADSQTDPGDVLDRSDSQTPSETQTSSGGTKWHHKITRKGSSSNFPLLSSKGSTKAKGGGLFSSRKPASESSTTPTVEASPKLDETDDDSSGFLSKSADLHERTLNTRSSGLSWSSIKERMTKKGDKTPSVSEASFASETQDEDEEQEEEV
ncbi:MAG: hypothetical protein M1820_008770 [Bogoriella megaspora]|nr:MAG: hypothetical protein M1820_008770 [Bogoriella megaspora]